MNVDRIRNGVTERGWAHVDSGNGVAIDTTGQYLYVAQTFRPAAIQRVTLTDPPVVTPYFTADPADIAAGFDGMARDDADRLFVAANGSGEVWRVSGSPPAGCLLLDGLPGFPNGPSAVATGVGNTQFPATSLYVVTFDGKLIELTDVAISNARPAGPATPPASAGKRAKRCKKRRKPKRRAAAAKRKRCKHKRKR